MVVLFCIFVYDIWIQLYDLGPPMSEKAGKESQFGLAPLFCLGGGRERDKGNQHLFNIFNMFICILMFAIKLTRLNILLSISIRNKLILINYF